MPPRRSSDNHNDMVVRARRLAGVAHRYQKDKVGRPYIEHPARVATYVHVTSQSLGLTAEQERDAIMVAWLHDVLEDSPYTETVFRHMGFSETVIENVVLLTRSSDIPEDEYYAKIMTSPIARAVKWADMIDNCDPYRLALLDDKVATRLIAKYDRGAACLEISPTPTQWWTMQRQGLRIPAQRSEQ